MARKRNKIQSAADYLYDQWLEGDQSAANKILEYVKSGDIELKIIKSNSEVCFFPQSKCDGTCTKCGGKYSAGSGVFALAKQYWHASCGSSEDQKNSYYKGWIKKQQPAQDKILMSEDE